MLIVTGAVLNALLRLSHLVHTTIPKRYSVSEK